MSDCASYRILHVGVRRCGSRVAWAVATSVMRSAWATRVSSPRPAYRATHTLTLTPSRTACRGRACPAACGSYCWMIAPPGQPFRICADVYFPFVTSSHHDP